MGQSLDVLFILLLLSSITAPGSWRTRHERCLRIHVLRHSYDEKLKRVTAGVLKRSRLIEPDRHHIAGMDAGSFRSKRYHTAASHHVIHFREIRLSFRPERGSGRKQKLINIRPRR